MSIYDRNVAKDVTRWVPKTAVEPVVTAATVTVTLSNPFVDRSGTATLTFSPSAAINDAFGLAVSGAIYGGATYAATAAMTASAFAAAVASAITTALPEIGAVASGDVVTLTNNSAGTLYLQATVGNQTSFLQEVHRTRREAQIIVAANTPNNRDLLADAIDETLATSEIDFGFTLADGTWVRVWNQGDISLDDNITHNVYRRDFVVGLEYGVTYQDLGYSVLAPLMYLQGGYQ